MITLKKAERIISYPITMERNQETKEWTAVCDWEAGVVKATGVNVKVVLQELIDITYKLRCAEVRRLANYRCSNCGKGGPLQIHHIVFRSHGRVDKIENLSARCIDCHRIAHGG
jgi:hypothetical protein